MKPVVSIFLAVFLFAASGCDEQNKNASVAEAKPVLLDSMQGACPYLTKDNKGNAVLSWVRTINDSSAVFCYAVSTNGGKSFETPVVIPKSDNIQPHGENLPKIIFKPSGEIIALWGIANPNPSNKYSGLVYYAQSFDQGKNWSAPRPLVSDTSGFDQRYYDVALLPNGEAGVIWLDNRTTSAKEGSALYFASTSGKNGFQNEKRISESCCQCCRTDLFVDSKKGIHVLYRGIIKDSIRDMVHAVSTDGGDHFSEPKRISEDNWVINGCPHTGPAMTENNKGLHFAWFTGGKNKGSFYTKSTDNGNSFDKRYSISSLGSHPQLATLADGALVIVWDESVQAEGKMYKRIGIQKRNAEGVSQEKKYITSENRMATFPVISPVDQTSSLVAYSVKKNDRSFIEFQLVHL
jgi:hypothetical protein